MAKAVPSGAPIRKARKLAVRLTPSDTPTIWRSSTSKSAMRLAAVSNAWAKSFIASVAAHPSKRLALQQPRHLAGQSRSLADEQVFQRRGAVDETKTDIAHRAEQRRFVGEQEIERIGGNAHCHGVETPPTLVALEHTGFSNIHAEPRRIDHHLGQRCDILQPNVETLAGYRMNDMRGVADQREPIGDEGSRDEIGKGKGARLVEHLDLAEMQAKTLLELGEEFRLAQGCDAGGLAAPFRPHQRRTLPLQRQDRERAGGHKMLLGAPTMVTLMPNSDNDAGLIIVPAMGRDARTLA